MVQEGGREQNWLPENIESAASFQQPHEIRGYRWQPGEGAGAGNNDIRSDQTS